ncbi:ImmA/IrrE family metallo-endopeptidase [Streptomyces sp. NPDC002490]|uniref:ImmA/IrrE family metallo-endopeptidase n=1 Tax=Streptomyces sp. NPDC002490 TaxID=3154416 RepID=UPI003324967C
MGSRWTKRALEGLALEERQRIGADLHDPLDLTRLTDEWGVRVYELSDLAAHGCSPAALDYFSSAGAGQWSAALVPAGTGCFILVNSSHTPQRRRSNIAHEMGHLLLEHEFSGLLVSDGGCRSLDPAMKVKEQEAHDLSAELLIPKSAAIKAAFDNLDDPQVAQRFDVSVEFARMRMNSSGARKIAARYRAKRR